MSNISSNGTRAPGSRNAFAENRYVARSSRMAHPGNNARKKRNLNNANLQGQLLLAQSKNAQLGQLVMSERAKAQHLVLVLIACVGLKGREGMLVLPGEVLAQINDTMRLQEFYNNEDGSLTLQCVLDEAPEPPAQPLIHLLDGDDAT